MAYIKSHTKNQFKDIVSSAAGITTLCTLLGIFFGLGMYIKGLLTQLDQYNNDLIHFQEIQELKANNIKERLDKLEKRVDLIEENFILHGNKDKK